MPTLPMLRRRYQQTSTTFADERYSAALCMFANEKKRDRSAVKPVGTEAIVFSIYHVSLQIECTHIRFCDQYGGYKYTGKMKR